MPLEPYTLPPPTSGTGLPQYINPITPATQSGYGGILPQYIPPIRPNIYNPPVNNNPLQYSPPVSIQPRNFFSGLADAVTNIAGAVRTGAQAIGDATRTFRQVSTTVRGAVQDVRTVGINEDTQGLTAAPPQNSGNTLTIPYLLPQGVGNNPNTYLIAGGIALLVIVLLLRRK